MFQNVMMVTMEQAVTMVMMCVTMTTIHIDVSECDDSYYGAGCSKQCPFCNHGDDVCYHDNNTHLMFQSVMMVTMERAAVSSVLCVTMVMMCVTMTTIHIDVSECDDGYYGAGCSKQCPFCNHGDDVCYHDNNTH